LGTRTYRTREGPDERVVRPAEAVAAAEHLPSERFSRLLLAHEH